LIGRAPGSNPISPHALDDEEMAERASRSLENLEETTMAVSVRYIVDDVDSAISFYQDLLGFAVDMHPGSGFAMLSRGDLRLLINRPGGGGGAGQAMPDGRQPAPGGWNRIQLSVDDLDAAVESLRKAGGRFRSEIIVGQGGRQILIEDPSGNPIELFEPAR
jgi:predicted enzyme related to lactoylglutathione lyase